MSEQSIARGVSVVDITFHKRSITETQTERGNELYFI